MPTKADLTTKTYRERMVQKVTYQGSKIISLCDLLNNKKKCAFINFKPDKKRKTKDTLSHCCHKICAPFLRHNFLRDEKLTRGLWKALKKPKIQ